MIQPELVRFCSHHHANVLARYSVLSSLLMQMTTRYCGQMKIRNFMQVTKKHYHHPGRSPMFICFVFLYLLFVCRLFWLSGWLSSHWNGNTGKHWYDIKHTIFVFFFPVVNCLVLWNDFILAGRWLVNNYIQIIYISFL